jgi:hypothetical protein
MRWIDGSSRTRYSSCMSEKPPLCPSAARSIRIACWLCRRRPFWAAVLPAVLVLEAVAVPGDGHWDRQFGMPGTASRNFALRFNGNSLYTAFAFRATATERAAYVIDHSADLVHWTALTTNSLSSLDVTNTAPGVNARHYRMREIP